MLCRCVLIVCLTLLGGLAIGCGSSGLPNRPGPELNGSDEVPGPQSEPNLEPDLTEASAADESEFKIDLKLGNQATLMELIAKHRGRVVLVDYWATWCPPCRKKFPQTVALAKQFAADGLSVIGVALDDKAAHGEVVSFLKSQRATFENLRSQDGTDDAAFEQFDIPDMAVPCLRLFDRSGKVVQTLTEFTDEQVTDAVRELLAK